MNVKFVNETRFHGFDIAAVTSSPAEVIGGRKIPVAGFDIFFTFW
jgi:hypothetical protein